MLRLLLTTLLVLALADCTYLGHTADERCREKKRSGEKTECKTDATVQGMAVDTAIVAELVDAARESSATETPVVLRQPCLEGEQQVCSITEDRCWCETADTSASGEEAPR